MTSNNIHIFVLQTDSFPSYATNAAKHRIDYQNSMGDLEGSIDFSVELGTFYNIDLFQRG